MQLGFRKYIVAVWLDVVQVNIDLVERNSVFSHLASFTVLFGENIVSILGYCVQYQKRGEVLEDLPALPK